MTVDRSIWAVVLSPRASVCGTGIFKRFLGTGCDCGEVGARRARSPELQCVLRCGDDPGMALPRGRWEAAATSQAYSISVFIPYA